MSAKKSKGKVLVAVSGGVDSSVAMMLLKEQGYDIAAAHMKLWDYKEVGGEEEYRDGRCCSLEAINDLRSICKNRDIPFYVLNFTSKFKELVIENFVSEYKKGRTPNPCILCNTHLKWEELLRKALEIGCDYIATGHYSQIGYDESCKRHTLYKGIDDSRDQSYALWGLSQSALSKTLLPLGGYRKSEIREMARKYKLKNASAPESMEICFVADNNYRRFLKEWDEKHGADLNNYNPGDIVDNNGLKLGEHQGIPFYTIGQRRGMGIAHPKPLYVQKLDLINNQIIVGDNDGLMQTEMIVSQLNWVSIPKPGNSINASVKIRYKHIAAEAEIIPIDNDNIRVVFDQPQRAITPGQSAVFYNRKHVLGGGIIDNSKK